MPVQEFQFAVMHILGKANVVADVLSRYPVHEKDQDDDPFQYLYPAYLVAEGEDIYEPYLTEILMYLLQDDQLTSKVLTPILICSHFCNHVACQ
jgi:hypothetical protein